MNCDLEFVLSQLIMNGISHLQPLLIPSQPHSSNITATEMGGKIWIMTIVVLLTVGIATCTAGEGECSRGAEFSITFDNVVSLADFLQNISDPELTFFKNVLKFSDVETELATQSAFDYFNTTFGLDFSESVPNEQGQRIFQNASFAACKAPLTATAKASHWLRSGNTNVKCYDVRIGWFGVGFLDYQVLRGTYGGTEGKTVSPDSLGSLTFQYTWIDKHPNPVVIQSQSTTPAHVTPDGVNIDIYAAFHDSLGNGTGINTLYVDPLPPDQTFARVVLYNTFRFPADQIP